jgi:putative hydrolase of the HAD superfamily
MPRPPLPHAIDAIVFDAGGTLIELDFPHIAALARGRGQAVEVANLRRGEVASRREIDARARRRGGVNDTDALRVGGYFRHLLAAAGLDAEAVEAVAHDVEVAHAEANLWRIPIDGALRAVTDLRDRGVRTAVVSNADGRAAEVLAAAGLAHAFEHILDSHHEGVEKPEPEIFRRSLSRLGVEAPRAAYVGDIYSIDVVGARSAGMLPVLVDPFDAFGDADCVRIRSLRDLLLR